MTSITLIPCILYIYTIHYILYQDWSLTNSTSEVTNIVLGGALNSTWSLNNLELSFNYTDTWSCTSIYSLHCINSMTANTTRLVCCTQWFTETVAAEHENNVWLRNGTIDICVMYWVLTLPPVAFFALCIFKIILNTFVDLLHRKLSAGQYGCNVQPKLD